MNKTILVLLALSLPLASLAQESQYRYADANQFWRQTDNAAGLSLDSAANRGVAYFDLQHREGDYRRVQEGGQKNQLEFFTERYQRISSILVKAGAIAITGKDIVIFDEESLQEKAAKG